MIQELNKPQTIEELNAQIEAYNNDPNVIKARQLKAEAERAERFRRGQEIINERNDFEERVKKYNEEHKTI